METPGNPFQPSGTVPGADCVKLGTCPRPAGFTTVVGTATLKAFGEEFDLQNGPNGSAKIPFFQRAARLILRAAYHAADTNAKNNSLLPPGTNCESTGSCLIPPLTGDAPNLDAF
jgi:hypothetical protein